MRVGVRGRPDGRLLVSVDNKCMFVMAEYEQATLICGFAAGSRMPSVPTGAFDPSDRCIFGSGSYAPTRQYLEMIRRDISGQNEYDGQGGVFNGRASAVPCLVRPLPLSEDRHCSVQQLVA